MPELSTAATNMVKRTKPQPNISIETIDFKSPMFKVGSEEYWASALVSDSEVPPNQGPEAASDLMSVRDMMPSPWDNYV